MSASFQPAGDGRRLFQTPKNLAPSAELTPLIDVVFQLLLFFMLSSTFVKPALDIELPRATSGAPPRDNAPLVLSVSATGNLDLNGKPLTRQELQSALQAAIASREDVSQRSLTLRADASLPYGDVVEIMDTAKKSGAASLKLEYQMPGK